MALKSDNAEEFPLWMSLRVEKGSAAGQAVVQAAWPRGPYNLEGYIYIVESVSGGKRWNVSLWQNPTGRIIMHSTGILEQGHTTCSGELYFIWEPIVGMILALV